MNKPWLDWDRKRFRRYGRTTGLAAVLVFIFSMVFIENTALLVTVLVLLMPVVVVGLYVVFTWAQEQDRRNPPWER